MHTIVYNIQEHGFYLNKTAFWDAIYMRYGWKPERMPDKCICSAQFSVEHAITCPRGGFTFIRHNEIRDLTANLLSEVCHGVQTEPDLQPLTGETFSLQTANGQDNARLDIQACGFWGERRQDAFFDVRVFNCVAFINKRREEATRIHGRHGHTHFLSTPSTHRRVLQTSSVPPL